jgi:hypothetical protein
MAEDHHQESAVDLSPGVSDEVKRTTCCMRACRCGTVVHLLRRNREVNPTMALLWPSSA